MSRKRSLAEELAELINPAPTKEHDPEADPFDAGPALEASDEELGAAAHGRDRRASEPQRLRGDIALGGRQYAGRRSSRAAAFGGSDSDSEGGGEEEGGSESESEEPGSESGEEGGASEGEPSDGLRGAEDWLEGPGGSSDEAPEEHAAGGRARNSAVAANGTAHGSDSSDGHAGSSSDDEEGSAGAGGAAAAEDDEMAALEREYEEMRQAETAAAAGLRDRAARERRKALAVRAQKAVWGRALEARILLQRVLAGANRLPQGAVQAEVAAASPEVAEAYSGLAADAAAAVDQLQQLVAALMAQNPAVAEAAPGAAEGEAAATAAGRKRGRGDLEAAAAGGSSGVDALWEGLEALHAEFAAFRDTSIDRWHRKTVLTAGGAARGQLRALNQSVSKQVQQQLGQDPDGRVLRRTRVLRTLQTGQQRVLCAPGHQEAAEQPTLDSLEAEEERDPETFEDTEFYQTLLKEFLEGGSEGGAGGGGWYRGPKQRKSVDRRASKGRKLRYHVHDKLVDFMTPMELDRPQFAAQLFGNLFGGATPQQQRR